MKPPPHKPDQQRMPFNAPPSSEALASRGLELRKSRRMYKGEDGTAALARARGFDWGRLIVKETPYMAGPYWCWVCSKEAA
jgi:hypothetical protein